MSNKGYCNWIVCVCVFISVSTCLSVGHSCTAGYNGDYDQYQQLQCYTEMAAFELEKLAVLQTKLHLAQPINWHFCTCILQTYIYFYVNDQPDMGYVMDSYHHAVFELV